MLDKWSALSALLTWVVGEREWSRHDVLMLVEDSRTVVRIVSED